MDLFISCDIKSSCKLKVLLIEVLQGHSTPQQRATSIFYTFYTCGDITTLYFRLKYYHLFLFRLYNITNCGHI
jgi:hypothetical protein